VIDRDIHLARALLVEGNAMLRSVAAEQLRNLGIGHVSQTSRVRDARLLIEQEPFDIIICNREFEGTDESGQELLDELRRENQLPPSTVFIMVTSQATYHQVVEAAEAALDGLLVRPYTGAMLSERLMEARNRKRELADILVALEKNQTELAMARALKRFQAKLPYATFCGRLAAELLLTLNRAQDAQMVFEKLAQADKGEWARIGAARALLTQGDLPGARKVVQAVLQDNPSCADGQDLLGRILVENCDFDGALAAYRAASGITPGCLLRMQHAGALAFYQGESKEAQKLLERAIGLGIQSKLFDPLTLLLIAVLRHDLADRSGVSSTREQLQRYRERTTDSRRLQRFGDAAEVLDGLASNKTAPALEALGRLSSQAMDDDFDLEAANTLLLLWERVPAESRPAGEHEALVERIASRFCVSKAITEFLVASARRAEPAQAVIRRTQSNLAALTEKAMDQALSGQAAPAVKSLLEAGKRTKNAKLLEMASLIAQRQRDQVPEADLLIDEAATCLARSCQAANHIAGIQRMGRSPGGLKLRTRSPTKTDAAETANA
jgi:DNA-binding response OmpR family regulator